jgi:hypothetical protein
MANEYPISASEMMLNANRGVPMARDGSQLSHVQQSWREGGAHPSKIDGRRCVRPVAEIKGEQDATYTDGPLRIPPSAGRGASNPAAAQKAPAP